MQILKVTAVSSLVVLGLVLGTRLLAEDKASEGAMRIVLKAIKVAETKENGSSWDANDGKPDIVVSMRNLSDKVQKTVVTDEKTDTFEATYNSEMVLVSAGQKLQILVEDKDVASNDLIGKAEIDITAEMLKKGTVTISFAQVKGLTMEFRKP